MNLYANRVDVIGWTNEGNVIVDWYSDTSDEAVGSVYVLIEREPDQHGEARTLYLGQGQYCMTGPQHWDPRVREWMDFFEIVDDADTAE